MSGRRWESNPPSCRSQDGRPAPQTARPPGPQAILRKKAICEYTGVTKKMSVFMHRYAPRRKHKDLYIKHLTFKHLTRTVPGDQFFPSNSGNVLKFLNAEDSSLAPPSTAQLTHNARFTSHTYRINTVRHTPSS